MLYKCACVFTMKCLKISVYVVLDLLRMSVSVCIQV